MHLLADISAHGLGHLAQTAPVLNALRHLSPDMRLTVRSALSREQLAKRITTDFSHIAEGARLRLRHATTRWISISPRARSAIASSTPNWPQRVANEADWLRQHGIDAVLSNVAYLPLAAAAEAGIPAAGLCSLNWADLFVHYFGGEPWAADIHAQILAAYNAAKGFLRVTPGLPMTGIKRQHEIAPIAAIGRRDRTRVSQLLGLDESERWLLLAMGGMEFRLPLENWPQTPGVNWLVPGEWNLVRRDVRSIDVADLNFPDLLASVDAVVTKPGYGTFVEAACGGIPILYVRREDWPETPHFAAWLATHARAEALDRERLMSGNFIDAANRLWQTPAPPLPLAGGADEAARWLVTALRLA